MTHRALTWTCLLAVLMSPSWALAAEKLPNVPLPTESKKRLDTYRSASLNTLKNILTPMVERTTRGEEFLGARWTAESGRVITLLKQLQKAKVVHTDNAEMKKWYDAEIAAWQNVQKLGFELLDLHYKMASTVAEIEQDVKDSTAYFTRLKDIIGKTNEDVGDLNDQLAVVSAATKALDKLGPAVEKLGNITTHLSDHSQTLGRLIRQFHKRQLEFIKDRGKLRDHADSLSNLKVKNIDPDQTGVFVEFEKSWEATMTKTYERYVKAVAEWQKVNRWHDGKEQLYRTLKTFISNWGGMPLKFLTVGMPPFLPDSAFEIENHVIVLRGMINKAVKKFRSDKWAEISDKLEKADKDRRKLREDFEDRIDKIEMEARAKAAKAEEEFNKVTKPLQSEYNRLAVRLSGETDDSAKRTITQQMRDLRSRIAAAQNGLARARHDCLEVWQRPQEEAAYKEFRAAIKEIDDDVAELNKAKRDID